MQVNFDTNNCAKPNFGAIKYDGARKALETSLSIKELKEFKALVDKHKSNDLVDLILLVRNGQKINQANIGDNVYKVPLSQKPFLKHYSKRFYESPMQFIRRMVAKTEKRTEVVNELRNKSKLISTLDL